MQNIVCKFTVFSIKIALQKKNKFNTKPQKQTLKNKSPIFFNTVGDIVKDSSKL